MCYTCWQRYEKPHIKTQKVVECLPLIKKVLEHDMSGGSLHVQLDDWNLEDWLFCADEEGATEAEKACRAHMQGMTIEERASALARHEGYIEDKDGEAS